MDTNQDMTICSYKFLIKNFGEETLKTCVKKISNQPGHPLKIFGWAKLNLYLGDYEIPLEVMAYNWW